MGMTFREVFLKCMVSVNSDGDVMFQGGMGSCRGQLQHLKLVHLTTSAQMLEQDLMVQSLKDTTEGSILGHISCKDGASLKYYVFIFLRRIGMSSSSHNNKVHSMVKMYECKIKRNKIKMKVFWKHGQPIILKVIENGKIFRSFGSIRITFQ